MKSKENRDKSSFLVGPLFVLLHITAQFRVSFAFWRFLMVTLLFLGISLESYAKPTPILKEKTYYSLQFENDFFAFSGDRFYTHGTEFSIMPMERPAPNWLNYWASWFPMYHQGKLTRASYQIGQKLFTPSATEEESLITDDRPYAGWLYYSASVFSPIRRNKDFDILNSLTFTLGIVGPSAFGEETQNGFHSIIDSSEVKGWSNQINDELGFNLVYMRKWRIHQPAFNGTLQYEMGAHIAMALGNIYRYASGGMMLRLGKELGNDLGPPTIRPGFPGAAFFYGTNQLNWYLFAGYESRLVEHNIFLDGNTFSDSHQVSKEPIVGDFQVGAVIQWPGWRMAYSRMLRSKEFENQIAPVSYGALNLTWTQ